MRQAATPETDAKTPGLARSAALACFVFASVMLLVSLVASPAKTAGYTDPTVSTLTNSSR
ncbi:MAG: hypothetical protein AB1749_10510 [Pseudomonadota bacterium]